MGEASIRGKGSTWEGRVKKRGGGTSKGIRRQKQGKDLWEVREK